MRATCFSLLVLLLVLFIGASRLQAQTSAGCGDDTTHKYWVYLKDKGDDTKALFQTPRRLLAEEALQRRIKAGTPLDYYDLPVCTLYINQLKAMGLHINYASRWLNAVSVTTNLSAKDIQTAMMSQVVDVQPVRRQQLARTRQLQPENQTLTMYICPKPRPPFLPPPAYDQAYYGATWGQTSLLNLQKLHAAGYQGKGIRIGLFDSGFQGVDTLSEYAHIYSTGRFIDSRDFVDGGGNVYGYDDHGSLVLSVIFGQNINTYVGAATEASLLLARTEDKATEGRHEEDNWLRAMEWADSTGIDIISTSLNYNRDFDNPSENYTTNDLTGDIALITRAADIAASRGILVVCAAGNEGCSSPCWHYIMPPCDGDSVLCVGGVNAAKAYYPSSGKGPTKDGRVKPDVMAVGFSSAVITTTGSVSTRNGTSFATPSIAGLAACLMQKHSSLPAMHILYAIRQSADRYENPDTSFGYGIPDACIADSLLTYDSTLSMPPLTLQKPKGYLKIYGNPVSEASEFAYMATEYKQVSIAILDQNGRVVYKDEKLRTNTRYPISTLVKSPGIYYLQSTYQNNLEVKRIAIP